ncbi:MAG: SDR family oxidoreductase, partial [Propionibacteriaceae bacterium]|jgi:rhamnose utilization protein RhaD (predicted bifunctional aldolase and dehydrogenase)/NAD(P)-dependent dehydrogenase (short-subunit alcohol dehydrogenase family)|nr:SDR family oxidoreductase [Propionibacteriaceae bacterium]
LNQVRRLLPPNAVGQEDLSGYLTRAKLDPAAASASVETLVHALLPHPVVLHSHADVILQLTNTPDGAALVAAALGQQVLLVDYASPGVPLAAACQAAWESAEQESVRGIVVLNHGLFTFADTADQAMAAHLELVAEAADFISARIGDAAVAGELAKADPLRLAQLRAELCQAEGASVVMRRDASAAVASFTADPKLLAAAKRGVLTPDHVIWTRRYPLIGTDVAGYAAEYAVGNMDYAAGDTAVRACSPRWLLDPELGLLSVGRDAGEAVATADIARHTMASIAVSEQLGGYRPVGGAHAGELEFWDAQRDKLARSAADLSGRVALVTGAGSGIGHACAAALLRRGACVVGWDISADVKTAFASPQWLGEQVDVSDHDAQAAALERLVGEFGGLDIAVVSAGVFPKAACLGEVDAGTWRRTMAINVDAVEDLYGLIWPYLALSHGGGRVVVIASKNVAAPGPGAAAYSSSKAALTQLSRVAALEWAKHGIRVNMIHPDAVFDTALWTPELLATRAAHYGVTIDAYKRRNLLGVEVTSAAVGNLAAAMASELFACSTGVQLPIDGGNERVI